MHGITRPDKVLIHNHTTESGMYHDFHKIMCTEVIFYSHWLK